ncbi:hypothetical protein [Sphingobium agri]|uniref:Uncharacterized protein n=1 Tax=Sphingobium agri TaxID=2933566 RepID=A0ABT0DWJ7_9SPHN|nr:hypothetical protein [Sphingobium agri]MCK0531486.1 hypothetical protein [Sphingobium agri]
MTNETNPGTVPALQGDAVIPPVELAGQIIAHLDECSRVGKFSSIGEEHIRAICEALAAQSQPAATVQELGRAYLKPIIDRWWVTDEPDIRGRYVIRCGGATVEYVQGDRDDAYERMKALRYDDVLAALTAEPAAKAGDAPFEFDRYINGKLMAEGVTIERETTLEAAMVVAARIASKGANGEAPVLVYRPPALPRNSPSPHPDMGSGEAIGLIGEASFAEVVDCDFWSLQLHFGKGDDARDKMRAVSDALRSAAALSPPTSQSVEKMTEALEQIAASRFGLQGIEEDYGRDVNAYNYHAMRYWAEQRRNDQATAIAALSTLPHKEEATPAPVGEQGAVARIKDILGDYRDCVPGAMIERIASLVSSTPATETERGRG